MSIFGFPSPEEEKDYYDNAEKAMHDMPNRYGYKSGDRLYQGPHKEKKGCGLFAVLALVLSVIGLLLSFGGGAVKLLLGG